MSSPFLRILRDLFQIIFAVGVGLGISAMIGAVAGEDPWHVVTTIVCGALEQPYDRGMVLYFTTLLAATGISVALPLRAGVFNIGSEGQMLMGAFFTAIVGSLCPLNLSFIAISLGLGAAAIGGGLWGGIAGAIRSFRGGHEVISSIMLNFVAAGFTSWFVVEKFQAADSQSPETPLIAPAYMFSRFESFGEAPVTIAGLVMILMALLIWFVTEKSRANIRLKAVHQSPEAAEMAGYHVGWIRFWSFTVGAAVSGLAGGIMVMSEAARFRLDMSDGFGFLGIPVALLARGRILLVLLSAFLLGTLHHGASALDLELTKVGRSLAQVMEAVIVLSVVILPNLGGRILQWKNHRLRLMKEAS